MKSKLIRRGFNRLLPVKFYGSLLAIYLICLIFPKKIIAQNPATYASTTSVTIGPCTTSVTVQCWGGGGAGGGINMGANIVQGAAGGGGKGGMYTITTIPVSNGNTLYITVGAGGTGTNGLGNPGGATWVNTSNTAPWPSSIGAWASGGNGGSGATTNVGNGGSTYNTPNSGSGTIFNSGNGAIGKRLAAGNQAGGGGGGGGGTAADGATAIVAAPVPPAPQGSGNPTAASAGGAGGTLLGGNGGGGAFASATGTTVGTAGAIRGGGGGGSRAKNVDPGAAKTVVGGAGGRGEVIITYNIVTPPTAVTVSTAGTYCSNTTLTATGGGAGSTIYYQGTTSGGTSTSTPSSSELISGSGTYYFRAQNNSAQGCWGTQGSAAVIIQTPTTYYQDFDGDGFGNAAVTTSACSAPPGYVANSTDCNDANASMNTTFSFYADTDGDGFGAGSSSLQCAVNASTPPAGYSTNNTDCSPANPAINAMFSFYADTDGDGFGAGSSSLQCAINGSTPPAGYSLSNTDCSPGNAGLHTMLPFYVDGDGDGFGAGSPVMLCGANPLVPPTAGYSINNSDCNDGNNTIYPGATEICGNAIDEDCSGADLVCPVYFWTGTLSDDWHTAGNWSSNSVPVSGADVVIPDVSPDFFPLISSAVTVDDLIINSGASINVAASAGLTVDGTFDASAGTFVLQSDATGTAYLDDFSMGGNVIGAIQVQRHNPIGASGYRQLGTPVSLPNISGVNGFTVSGIPGFVIPDPACNPNYVAYNSPYGSWLQLVENGSLQFNCAQSLFQVLTAGGMTNGRGYYMDAAGNSTFTFTGTPNTGPVSYTITHTPANSAVTQGWNMVSNPYPSPLAWEMANVPAGIDAIGKIWVTSGAYSGTWQDIDPSAAGTQALAIGQAFQVRVTTPGNTVPFSVDNSDRTTSPPTYLFAGNDPMTLNIDILGNGFADVTKVRFIEGATPSLDAIFDSPKMLGNANQPMLYSIWDNKNYSTNSYGEFNEVYTLPLGVKIAAAGEHTLAFSNIDQFPATALIYLEDLTNGSMQDVRSNDTYSFTENVGDINNRFILHFYPPVENMIVDATCNAGGEISLVEESPSTWNYSLENNQSTIISQGVLDETQNISNLPAGNYTLTLTHQTSGYVVLEDIEVTGSYVVEATAQVSVASIEAGQEVQFTANTVNAIAWDWNFGDGNSSSVQNPVHVYNAAGNYTVTLVASNSDCDQTSEVSVSAYSTASIDDHMADVGVKMWNENSIVYIQFMEEWTGKTVFTLYDMAGKKIMQQNLNNANGMQSIDCGTLAAGTYTVDLKNEKKAASRKVVMGIK